MRNLLRRLRSDERGAGYMLAFIILSGALIGAGTAALADAGRVSAAQRHSSSIAYEAARVGAQEVVSAEGTTFALDAEAARAAAASAAINLASTSDARLGGVRVAGDEVIVTITFQVDRWFPGFGPVTITEVGRARFTSGITGEGQ